MHERTRLVLKALLDGKEHSGEAIAERLDISRAAVWKHISELRRMGYSIISASGRGYALVKSPDIPSEVEVYRYLEPKRLGVAIEYTAECESTNLYLKQQAERGAREGSVVVAESQTAGRGRRGRTWQANPGEALLFSVLLRPTLPPRELFGLTLMAGVAVAEALEALGFAPQLKWPNDVLMGNKKICGILAEVNGEFDYTNYVVLGIGINVSGHPLTNEYQSASLCEFGPKALRAPLLAAVLRYLEANYELLLLGQIAAILNKWRRYSVTLGREVSVITPQGIVNGIAKDVDAEGALILVLPSGEEAVITAGDVSLRTVTNHTEEK